MLQRLGFWLWSRLLNIVSVHLQPMSVCWNQRNVVTGCVTTHQSHTYTHIPGLHTSCLTLQHANLCLSLFLRVCLTSEEILWFVFLLRVKHQQPNILPSLKSFSAQGVLMSHGVTISHHAPNCCANIPGCVGLTQWWVWPTAERVLVWIWHTVI